jgi:hypothetical protein
VCVFIAGPMITKLLAWGGGGRVCTSLPVCPSRCVCLSVCGPVPKQAYRVRTGAIDSVPVQGG